jgi:hypothetical protein
MLSRARRIADPSAVSRYDWEQVAGFEPTGDRAPWLAEEPRQLEAVGADAVDPRVQLAALERDAFAHGYASGSGPGSRLDPAVPRECSVAWRSRRRSWRG